MATKEEIYRLFDCEMDWVRAMSNRLVVNDLMKIIIKEAGKRGKDVVFGGTCIIGGPYDNLTPLIDKDIVDGKMVISKEGQSLDLISLKKRWNRVINPGYQSLYADYADWLRMNPPQKGKCNIYFVGHGHGATIDLSIHWVCYIVEARPNIVETPQLFWFDPSMDLSSEIGYNFDYAKKYNIIVAMKEGGYVEGAYDIRAVVRPQQFCGAGPAQDVFCQTWVLMFASAYINNAVDGFLNLDFIRLQSLPLKYWSNCIVSKLHKSWKPFFAKHYKDYTKFFSHCRKQVDKGVKIEKLSRFRKGKEPCIYTILSIFLTFPGKYDPHTYRPPIARKTRDVINLEEIAPRLRRSQRGL